MKITLITNKGDSKTVKLAVGYPKSPLPPQATLRDTTTTRKRQLPVQWGTEPL